MSYLLQYKIATKAPKEKQAELAAAFVPKFSPKTVLSAYDLMKHFLSCALIGGPERFQACSKTLEQTLYSAG